jgi:dTDP-4-dehydrorhamnose 3,5-epimerase
MHLLPTALPDVLILQPVRHADARGWFSETWSAPRMAALGLDRAFVQDNHSFSARRGTLRGLHYQAPPCAQDKLVRCTRGAVFDVAVDARRGSACFGQWVRVELSAQNGRQLLVPRGFLHGFVTLCDDTEVQYSCTETYAPDCDGAVHYGSLGIDWGVDPDALLLSDKDARAPAFADWTSPFTYGAA